MSLETLTKLERRIEEAAKRLKALVAERATLAGRLEELEARLKAQQSEIERSQGAEGEAMRQRQAAVESETRRLQGERQTIRDRVETMLTRLDKLDLD